MDNAHNNDAQVKSPSAESKRETEGPPSPSRPERPASDDADVRGEHRYPHDQQTDAERRAGDGHASLRRKLEKPD